MVLHTKIWGRAHGVRTLDNAMGIGQAIDAHTGACRQCADAIETGIHADWPACILHTGMGSGGLWQAKSETGLPM